MDRHVPLDSSLTVSDIRLLFQKHGVRAGTRSLDDLATEISLGESVLVEIERDTSATETWTPPSPLPCTIAQHKSLYRKTRVAVVTIAYEPDRLLLLHRQKVKLSTGETFRTRIPKPLSEKILRGETPYEAACRGCMEELGATPMMELGIVIDRAQTPTVHVEWTTHGCYGSIATMYELFLFHATAANCNHQTFQTIEGTKWRHYWVWQPCPPERTMSV